MEQRCKENLQRAWNTLGILIASDNELINYHLPTVKVMELHKEESIEGSDDNKNDDGNEEDDNNNKYVTNEKNKRTGENDDVDKDRSEGDSSVAVVSDKEKEKQAGGDEGRKVNE